MYVVRSYLIALQCVSSLLYATVPYGTRILFCFSRSFGFLRYIYMHHALTSTEGAVGYHPHVMEHYIYHREGARGEAQVMSI